MRSQVRSGNVADLLVERLIAAGVQDVFGVGGANIEDMFAAVQRGRPAIRAVLAKHEHGAASAAAANARVRGGLGVVLATSGGGAMNLVHGLAEARASHVPLLAIVGEPPLDLQGAGAFQDTSGRAGQLDEALRDAGSTDGPSVISVVLEEVEVPPFVAFQRADPTAKTVARGGSHAGE
jgi:acetolactate synthase I/II/III large subunit